MVEDLGEREVGLEDRNVVAVAGLAVGGRERVREAAKPLAREGVNPRRGESIGEGLGTAGISAGEEPSSACPIDVLELPGDVVSERQRRCV
jgi:hypothetical protein